MKRNTTVPADRYRSDFLARLYRRIATAAAVEDIAAAVLEFAEELWDFDAYLFSVRRSGRSRFRTILKYDTIEGAKTPLPADEFGTAACKPLQPLFDGQSVLINRSSPGETPVPKWGSDQRGSESLIFAPLMQGDRLIGMVSVQSYEPNHFTAEDEEFLRHMAASVAPALERCMLESRAAVILSLGDRLNRATAPRDAARIIVGVADQLIGWDACSLHLYSPRENRIFTLLLMDLIDGVRKEAPPTLHDAPPTEIMLKTLTEGPLLILKEFPEQTIGFHPFGDESRPSASIMWTPVNTSSGPIGFLSLQSYTLHAYDEEDLQLLEALAGHCGIALARTQAQQALAEREQRYRRAITVAGAVPYQLDYQTGQFTFMGEGIEAISGFPAAAFTTQLLKSLIISVESRGEAARLAPKKAAELARQGQIKEWKVDICIRTKTGQTKWLSDTSVQLVDEHERAVGSIGILEDITDRKVSEQSLRESEERYRLAIAEAGAVPYERDHTNESFVFVGEGILGITGYSAEEITVPIWRSLIHETVLLGEHAGKTPQQVIEELRADRTRHWKSDVRIVDRHGQTHWVYDSSIQLYDKEGRRRGALGILQDITERKNAEVALRESEQQLKHFIEHAADPFLINDLTGRLVEVNQQACNSLGYTRSELLNMTVFDLVPDADYDSTMTLWTGLQPGKPITLESTHRRKDGTMIPVEIRLGSIESQGMRMVMAVARNISDRRRAETERAVFSRLGTELAAADSLDDVASAVHTAVDHLWKWDALFISVRRSGTRRFRLLLNADTVDGERKYFPSRDYEATVTEDLTALYAGKPLLINRADESDYSYIPRGGDPNRRAASLLYAPMLLADRIVGILSIQSYAQDFFSENDLRRLHRLGEVTSTALERCRAEERTVVFSEFGSRLSSAGTPEEVARIALAAAERLLGWDAATVSLYIASEERIVPLVWIDTIDGEKKEYAVELESSAPRGYMRRTLDEGPTLLLRSEKNATETTNLTFGDKARLSASLIWVPIRSHSRAVGVISVQSYTPEAYDDHDLALMLAVADHCSGAFDRTRAEQALRRNEQIYRQAIAESGAVPYQRDYRKNKFIFIGDEIERLTGFSAAEMTTEVWHSLIQEIIMRGENTGLHYEAAVQRTRSGEVLEWKSDLRIQTRTGETRWVSDSSIQLIGDDGRAYGSLGILQDITDRKQAEAQLQFDAFHDSLTHMPNRALLLDRLDRSVSRALRRTDYHYALLFLDLDRFKNINDSLGHLIGDEVLCTIAERLKLCLRPGDTVARFAGDEFCMLLDDILHPEDAIHVAERVQSEIMTPMSIRGHEVFTSASMGIALSMHGYERAEDVLRDADNALYRAKAAGKARYQVFDISMHKHVVSMMEMENKLRHAVAEKQFVLHYQPIIETETGKITAFEALVRWIHPEKGLISPDTFIPLAEETGLIIPIGWWVLEQAARQLQEWRTDFPDYASLGMCVNFSPRQIAAPDLERRIAEILSATDVDPAAVSFEITESVLIDNPQTSRSVLEGLKRTGFQLHLDDFGTSYSSLSYLHQYPFDLVKIDRSFVGRMTTSPKEAEIVRSIILLATNLGMSVTAEGVETAEQARLLQQFGCSSVQGFYYSMPMDSAGAAHLLRANTCLPAAT